MSGPSLQPTQSNHVRYQGSYSPSFPTHSKFLGGAGENDLAAQQASWYQEAYAYYNAVAAGEIERPSEEQWNEFLNQMNWVYSQLNGYSGGDTSDVGFDGEQGFSEQSRGPAINEFGGVEGPNQNWVYDSPESEITAQPDGMRHDVYGFTNTLNVPSASGKVTHEITSDGLEPAGRVLKVVVTTAQGESVYYYHNWESPDFKLDIKVPQTSQVTGSADLGTHLKVSKLSDRTGPARRGRRW